MIWIQIIVISILIAIALAAFAILIEYLCKLIVNKSKHKMKAKHIIGSIWLIAMFSLLAWGLINAGNKRDVKDKAINKSIDSLHVLYNKTVTTADSFIANCEKSVSREGAMYQLVKADSCARRLIELEFLIHLKSDTLKHY